MTKKLTAMHSRHMQVTDAAEMPAAPSPATTPRRLVGGPPVAPPSPAGSKGSAGDVSCAICLEHAEQEELAMVKGCDHSYCGASFDREYLQKHRSSA